MKFIIGRNPQEFRILARDGHDITAEFEIKRFELEPIEWNSRRAKVHLTMLAEIDDPEVTFSTERDGGGKTDEVPPPLDPQTVP